MCTIRLAGNRLVADSLEAQWNEKLRLLADTREGCDKKRELDSARLATVFAVKLSGVNARGDLTHFRPSRIDPPLEGLSTG